MFFERVCHFVKVKLYHLVNLQDCVQQMEHGQCGIILFQENDVSRIKNKFESSNFVANQKCYLPISCVIKQISRKCALSTHLKKYGSEVGRIEKKPHNFHSPHLRKNLSACVCLF